MHIPAEPGPGSSRSDWSLLGSLPPFGRRSLARRLIQPEEGDGARFGALRPGARGRVGRVARLVFMGGIEIRETPVWNMTIN